MLREILLTAVLVAEFCLFGFLTGDSRGGIVSAAAVAIVMTRERRVAALVPVPSVDVASPRSGGPLN